MKVKKHIKILSLITLFLMAMSLYNCKPEPSEPEVPKFEEEYKDVKLPDVTPTKPAAVTMTTGSVQASAAVADLSTGLASGTVTPGITAAATEMQKIIAPEAAAKLTEAFTPAVIKSMTSGGTLPANLKTQLDAIASNPSFAAYLPKITYPTVNGKPITGFIKETNSIGNESISVFPDYAVAQITSPCTIAARDAYNAVRKTLDEGRTAQRTAILNEYNTSVSAANATATAGKNGLAAIYNSQRNTATQSLNQALAILETSKATLGNDFYNMLTLLYLSSYNSVIEVFNLLQKADEAAYNNAATEAIANAATARDNDYGRVQTNYNNSLALIDTKLEASFKTCHDQGQGD